MARKNLLKGFKKPKGISFEHISTNPNYGKFTAYPFEPGMVQLLETHSAECCCHLFKVMQFLQSA